MPRHLSAVLVAVTAWVTPVAADLSFSFFHYDVEVQFSNGFGIRSLKYRGQESDFAGGHLLPLGDWEWFWLEAQDENNRPTDPALRAKLLEPAWDPPVIREEDARVILDFLKPDVLREDLELAVEMAFSTVEPRFDITYTIRNGTPTPLSLPYIMVGLPGFLDHGSVTAIETGDGQRREPLAPHQDFLSEALEDGRSEYLLLRHDLSPAAADSLQGVAEIVEGSTTFALAASYAPAGSIRHVYSAHTNKPRYLTSHLYVFLGSLPADAEHRVTVHYNLSRTIPPIPTSTSPTPWGALKRLPCCR